jgi:hypothetical protein
MQAEDGERNEIVPEVIVTRANELFTRMHKLATYHFADHPDEGPIVVAMNAGPGHRKLANHLVTLSELYGRHPEVVKGDAKNYVASDARNARVAAGEIIEALSESETTEVKLWKGRSARIWTLLMRSYGEVQMLGRWLLRATPEAAAERLPSLVSEVRSAPVVRRADTPTPTPDPAAPVVVAPVAAKPRRKRRTR